jgi:hypothetical protein
MKNALVDDCTEIAETGDSNRSKAASKTQNVPALG